MHPYRATSFVPTHATELVQNNRLVQNLDTLSGLVRSFRAGAEVPSYYWADHKDSDPGAVRLLAGLPLPLTDA